MPIGQYIAVNLVEINLLIIIWKVLAEFADQCCTLLLNNNCIRIDLLETLLTPRIIKRLSMKMWLLEQLAKNYWESLRLCWHVYESTLMT